MWRATSPASRSPSRTTSTPRTRSALSIRASVDQRLDRNGLPLDANGNIEFNELGNLHSDPHLRPQHPDRLTYDPDVLNGWGKRGYNWEYTISSAASAHAADVVERRLVPPLVRQPDVHERPALTTKSSYDGPFCVNAPVDANLPGGGGYPVCSLFDSEAVGVALGLPANNLLTFSKNFGGETNVYRATTCRSARGRTVSSCTAGVNGRTRTSTTATSSKGRLRRDEAPQCRRPTQRNLPGRHAKPVTRSFRIVRTSSSSARTRSRATSIQRNVSVHAAVSRTAARLRRFWRRWSVATHGSTRYRTVRSTLGRARPGSAT